MIVLGVAHTHRVVRRKPQLFERGGEPGRLVDPGRQHHHRTLVEDHLALQPQLANHLEHGRLVRLPRRHDHLAHGQRLHPAPGQRLDQLARRRLAQEPMLTCSRPVQHGAVLGHHMIEQVQAGEHAGEIVQHAPRHEDELAARLACPLQGGKRCVVHTTVLGQGPVIVTS
jgi:hypothetical protein